MPNADEFPVLAGSITPPIRTPAINGFSGNGGVPNGPTAAQVLQAPPPPRKDSKESSTRGTTPDPGRGNLPKVNHNHLMSEAHVLNHIPRRLRRTATLLLPKLLSLFPPRMSLLLLALSTSSLLCRSRRRLPPAQPTSPRRSPFPLKTICTPNAVPVLAPGWTALIFSTSTYTCCLRCLGLFWPVDLTYISISSPLLFCLRLYLCIYRVCCRLLYLVPLTHTHH